MDSVNVHDAKTHLSRLLEQVRRGEEVVIAKRGEPIARLVPFSRKKRQPGSMRGRIRMAEDFDAPLPEALAAAFRGEAE